MVTILLLAFVASVTLTAADDAGYRYENVESLTELSIRELLAQKKNMLREEKEPVALPLVGNHSRTSFNPMDNMQIKGLHRLPARKSIYDEEDEEEEDEWLPKKKSKSKFSKLFEISVTTLSFLAFGSYLLCLMVSAMRQKSTDALAAVGTTVPPQIQLLQQILGSNKPFPVRIPTATSFAIHPGRKRRSGPYGYYQHLYAK